MTAPVCDAYSGGCVTPGPTLFPSTSPPPRPPALPVTGLQVGDLVLLAVLALALGALALVLVRVFRDSR